MTLETIIHGVSFESSRSWHTPDMDMHIRQIENLAGLCSSALSGCNLTENAGELAVKLEAVLIELEARAEWLRDLEYLKNYPKFTAAQAGAAT